MFCEIYISMINFLQLFDDIEIDVDINFLHSQK